MAVSGSKNYSITRADIIGRSLRLLGVYDQADTVPGDEDEDAALALNMLFKEYVAREADLFLRQDVTLFLQPQQKIYTLGLSGNAETTISTDLVETTLSADEASGQTTISLTSVTGMSASDRIGVKIDDDSIHWTTISGVPNATANTALLATATDGAASSGNKVYTYTTKADRPQKLIYAWRRDTSDQDTEVSVIGEAQYQRQSTKISDGPPTEVWYRPTLDTGSLHVWPIDGGKTTDKLIYIANVLPDDMDAAGDNPQFPIEWGNTLAWGLAAEIGPEYGIPNAEQKKNFVIAESKLQAMLDYDVENADVVFALDLE